MARHAASAAEKRDARNPYVIALELQLGRLRRLEDPSNDSPTAVVYREMLVAAEKRRRVEDAAPRYANGQLARLAAEEA